MSVNEGREYREVLVSGELTPEKWELLSEMLGGLGVLSEVLLTETIDQPAEVIYDPRLLSAEEDFDAFAQATNQNLSRSGRAWNSLNQVYLEKMLPERYQHLPAYHPAHYHYVPPLFAQIAFNRRHMPEAFELRLEALEQYIQNIYRLKQNRRDVKLTQLLPRDAGMTTLKFWEDFAVWKRQQVANGDTAAQQ